MGGLGLGYNLARRFFVAMDLRLLLVVAPILLAASWAVFHIGRAAVGQLQLFIKRAQA
jgi:photosystem II PsbY protein